MNFQWWILEFLDILLFLVFCSVWSPTWPVIHYIAQLALSLWQSFFKHWVLECRVRQTMPFAFSILYRPSWPRICNPFSSAPECWASTIAPPWPTLHSLKCFFEGKSGVILTLWLSSLGISHPLTSSKNVSLSLVFCSWCVIHRGVSISVSILCSLSFLVCEFW